MQYRGGRHDRAAAQLNTHLLQPGTQLTNAAGTNMGHDGISAGLHQEGTLHCAAQRFIVSLSSMQCAHWIRVYSCAGNASLAGTITLKVVGEHR